MRSNDEMREQHGVGQNQMERARPVLQVGGAGDAV